MQAINEAVNWKENVSENEREREPGAYCGAKYSQGSFIWDTALPSP